MKKSGNDESGGSAPSRDTSAKGQKKKPKVKITHHSTHQLGPQKLRVGIDIFGPADDAPRNMRASRSRSKHKRKVKPTASTGGAQPRRSSSERNEPERRHRRSASNPSGSRDRRTPSTHMEGDEQHKTRRASVLMPALVIPGVRFPPQPATTPDVEILRAPRSRSTGGTRTASSPEVGRTPSRQRPDGRSVTPTPQDRSTQSREPTIESLKPGSEQKPKKREREKPRVQATTYGPHDLGKGKARIVVLSPAPKPDRPPPLMQGRMMSGTISEESQQPSKSELEKRKPPPQMQGRMMLGTIAEESQHPSKSELEKPPPLTTPKETSRPRPGPRPPSPETVILVEPKVQQQPPQPQPPKRGRVTVLPEPPIEVRQRTAPDGGIVQTKVFGLGDKTNVKVEITSQKPKQSPPLPQLPAPPPRPGLPEPKPILVAHGHPGRTKSQDLMEYLAAISRLSEQEIEHHEVPSPDFLDSVDGALQVLKKFGIPDQGKCLDSLLDTDSVRFDFGGLMRQYYSYVLRSYCLINMQDRYRGLHHSTPCFSAIDLSKIGTREEEQAKVTKAKMKKLDEERKRLRTVSTDDDHFNYLLALSNNQPTLLPLTIVHTMNEAMAPFLEDVFRCKEKEMYGKNLGTEHNCTKEAGFHYMKIRKRCEMYNNICGGSTLDENLEQFYK